MVGEGGKHCCKRGFPSPVARKAAAREGPDFSVRVRLMLHHGPDMSEPWPVIDLNALGEGGEAGPEEEGFRDFCGAIVMAATARLKPVAELLTAVHCGGSPDTTTCTGTIRIRVEPGEEEIRWWCERCEQRGSLTGWPGSPFDLSGISVPGAKQPGVWLELSMSPSQYDALLGVEFHDEVIKRLLHAARRSGDDVILRAPRLALRHLLENMAVAATHAKTRSDWELFDSVFSELERVLGR